LAAPAVSGAAGFDHSGWDRVLKAAVNPIGEVEYAALKASPAELERYVEALAAAGPTNRPGLFASRQDELAYYINAYNALTTWGVVQRYPLASVRSIGTLFSFFRTRDYTLAGLKISLHELENDIIRKRYAEPRIHFAIVCASLSCPKLAREAYTGENLFALLERQTRAAFAERRTLEVDRAANTVTLTALLDWYGRDFEPAAGLRGKPALIAYAARYAPPETRRALLALQNPRILFREYDWSINDPGSRARAASLAERELAAGAQ
jgi:hypothetical protein